MLGKEVGSYQITEKLAEGGMGVVYVAHHKLMSRDAVVKVLHDKLSHDKDAVTRFFNEAQAAARIKHPGIVEIYDFGYEEDQAYIIMAKLHGENLAARIARGAIPVDRTVVLARQIASALGEAHACDIIHRDLKPENIFVVPDPDMPGGERVKVLDFGVAKLAPERGEANLTARGSVFGTPAYMAPEQCEDAANVDCRTDLYAIGCILYEMVCARPPFGKGGLALLAAHLRDEPEPPSKYSPTIPEELEAIILRLLAKKPARRYQSCDELIKALETADLTPRPMPVGAGAGEDPALAATMPPDLGHAATALPGRRSGSQSTGDSLAASSTASGPVSGAVSPTTHSRATGEIAEARSVAGSGRKTGLVVSLGLVLLLAAGAGAYFVMGGQREEGESSDRRAVVKTDLDGTRPTLDPVARPPVIAAKADAAVPAAADNEHLREAEKALGEMRWVDAMVASKQVLDEAAEGSPAHRRAQEIREAAEEGFKLKGIYEDFTAAVAKKDVETVVAKYAELPEGDAYRQQATPVYEAFRDKWLAPRLKDARRNTSRVNCRKVESIRREVAAVFAESTDEFDSLVRKCHKAENKPGDGKPGDGKPGDGKPGDGKPGDGKLPLKVTKQEIARQLRVLRVQVRPCLAKLRSRLVVKLSFEIQPSGKVKKASSSSGNAELDACVVKALQGLEFPKARKATSVNRIIRLGRARRSGRRLRR